MNILIVDDHAEFRQTLKLHLADGLPGSCVREFDSRAGSPGPIVDALDDTDVVLMDHRLDGLDGFELLGELRRAAPAVPVIVLSSRGDETVAARAFKAGVADYLPKAQVTVQSLTLAVSQSMREPVVSTSSRPARAAPLLRHPPCEIKGYRIESRLAQSALSSVWQARDVRGDGRVAIKILSGLVGSQSEESLERFLREYETASSLQHRNVVGVLDFGFARDQVYIVMEYLPGGTLRERMAHGPLPAARGLEIVLQVLEALEAMHAVGILHRDLKPGNVMFRDDAGACVIDFGLAKHVQIARALTIPGRLYGTPYYMSPEQGQGLALDGTSDYYSLGAVLFEMLTGTKPYTAGTPVALVFKHAHAPIPRLAPALARWQPLIDGLMAKRRADRPRDPEAVRRLVWECKRL